jgi:branched-chain amino acid transport system substrate-binding protein
MRLEIPGLRAMRTALAAAAVAALVACSGGEKQEQAAASTGDAAGSADEIVLGQFASLTGDTATFGTSSRNGVDMAVEEVNAKGGVNGKKIRVITYDTRGTSQEAGNAVTRLVTRDKVVAVLGEVASSLSLAGAAVCQEKGVPMLSPASTNVKVTQVGDMIHRICFVDSFQGYVMAKFAKDTLKVDNVALLYDQSQAYSTGLRDDFTKAFTEMGGTVTTTQAYQSGETEFSAQLTSIRDTKPGAIYVPGYYTDIGTIAIQARRLGITVPLLGGDGWDSSKLAEIGGEALEGCFYSNHYSSQETRPIVKEFVDKYQKEYGEVPDVMAALGYDAGLVICDALARAKSTNGADLAAALSATKDVPGVTGAITLDAERNARKPAVVLEMKKGIPTFHSSVDPP